jgi:hypothetical protein
MLSITINPSKDGKAYLVRHLVPSLKPPSRTVLELGGLFSATRRVSDAVPYQFDTQVLTSQVEIILNVVFRNITIVIVSRKGGEPILQKSGFSSFRYIDDIWTSG